MTNYFECTAKYTKQMDNGVFGRVSEKFIVKAFTFGQAEEMMYKELEQTVKGELQIVKINPIKVQDVIYPQENPQENPLWKVKYKRLDGSEDKPKMKPFSMLITAATSEDANDLATDEIEGMGFSGDQFEITQITNTQSYFIGKVSSEEKTSEDQSEDDNTDEDE